MKKNFFLNRDTSLIQVMVFVFVLSAACLFNLDVYGQGFGGGTGFGDSGFNDSGFDDPGFGNTGDPEDLMYPGRGPLTEEEFNSMNPAEKAEYIRVNSGPVYRQSTLDPKFDAIEGQRVEDAYVNRTSNEPLILDDVRKIRIREEELGQYSDAGGGTMGDAISGDGIYTNVLPPSKNEYMGAQSFYGLSRKMDLLVAAQGMSVLDFFGLTAASTDRLSRLPNALELMERRDSEIYRVNEAGVASGWVDSFLADYRLRQDDIGSDFFPLYVPRPPSPPADSPPPAPWRPAGYQPDPLEVAIDKYLTEVMADPDNTADMDTLREELMLQLEDPEYKEEFLQKYGPAPEPEMGEFDDEVYDDDWDDDWDEEDRPAGGGGYYRPGAFGT